MARVSRAQRALAFKRIHVENWRNFTSVDIEMQRRMFVVGPNASGKSNLLDAFRFLRDIASVGGGFQEAVRRRGGVSRVRCLAARRYPDVAISVDIQGGDESPLWTYELRFKQDNRQRPIVEKESVSIDGKVLFVRPDADDTTDPERLTQTFLEQVQANQKFRPIADFLASIQYLNLVPQLVREPDRMAGRTGDPYGADFIEQIARTPEKTRNAWLRRIREALVLAVPQLRELEMWRDVRGAPHLRGKYEHWRPQGAWQTEGDFSDGTLRLMGLLWSMIETGGPLLLEEPEISLHPAVVEHVPQMLHRMQRGSGRQVMLTTHSSDLLKDGGIGLDEVLLLEPSREGTKARLASAIDEVRDLLAGGLTMGEIVLARTRPQGAGQLALFGA